MRRFDYLILAFMAATLVAATSDWVISGNVTYTDTFFDDLSVGSERAMTGAGTPNYAQVVGGGWGYYLANNDGLRFTLQTSHRQKLLTNLDLHVHVAPDGTDADGGNTRFTIDCACADINETFTVISTITSANCVMGTVADKHLYCDIGDINNNDGVSQVCACSLMRIAGSADDYTGEVAVMAIDAHYEIDGPGSRTETAK